MQGKKGVKKKERKEKKMGKRRKRKVLWRLYMYTLSTLTRKITSSFFSFLALLPLLVTPYSLKKKWSQGFFLVVGFSLTHLLTCISKTKKKKKKRGQKVMQGKEIREADRYEREWSWAKNNNIKNRDLSKVRKNTQREKERMTSEGRDRKYH
jgi:hypothetical protein